MQTTHSTFLFAGHRLHQIDFDPATFAPHDILWLPHHQQLENCGRKRQMEHLAGRIAAACALKAVGVKGVPGTGDQRQPLWPVLRHPRAGRRRLPTGWYRHRKRAHPRAGDGAGEQYYQPDRTRGAEGERTALRIGSDAGFFGERERV